MDEDKLNETREEREKRKAERDLSDIRFLLKAPEGRRFLCSILGKCNTLQEQLSLDTNTTFVEKGMRAVGFWLLKLIFTAKPEAYTQILQEAMAEANIEKTIDDKLKASASA